MPYHRQSHPYTKLTKDCAAIIGWYDALVIPDDVIHLGGDVPPHLMIEINHAVRKDCQARLASQSALIEELLRSLP